MANYNEVTPKRLKNNKKKSTPVLQQPSWPPSLQSFVNASFERSESLDPAQKAAFGSQMQSLMEMALQQDKIWTNPWHMQTLPVFSPGTSLDLVQNTNQNHNVGQSVGQRSMGNTDLYRPTKKKKEKNGTGRYDSEERKRKRADRFGTPELSPSPSPSIPDTGSSAENGPIVGYLTQLEKRYLRLTSEPDPAVVRPQDVLEKSLDHVLNKYKENNSYLYVNDQLKAIRQDLTVQHIKNAFTIKVYKAHGRLAILHNDLGEFNQCSSQLKQLYAEDTEISDTFEFTCYRVLYLLLTGNYAEVNVIRLSLTDVIKSGSHKESKKGKKLKPPESDSFQIFRDGLHGALNLLNSMTLGDYHAIFVTYRYFRDTPEMTYAYHMMKHSMGTKQRVLALNTMCKAYRLLPREYLENELAFDESDPLDEFLLSRKIGQFLTDDFDCVGARATLQTIVDRGDFRKVDIKGQV